MPIENAPATAQSAWGLARLIAPMSPAEFLAEHWDRKPLHLQRGRVDHYESLLRAEELETIILARREPGRQIALVNAADPGAAGMREFMSDAWIRPLNGMPDVGMVHRAYARGNTVIVYGVHLCSQPVAALADRLREELWCEAGANLYLTPQQSQGVGPHIDEHDTLVLQIDGEKEWTLYDALTPLPLHARDSLLRPAVPRAALEGPTQTIHLRPGDLLYLPRGVPHAAKSGAQRSLHLTFGIIPTRWKDLVADALLQAAEADVRFREALPVKFGARPAPDPAQLRSLLEALLRNADANRAFERTSLRFANGLRPAGGGHFANLDEVDRIGADSSMEKRLGMVCTFGHYQGQHMMAFPGQFIAVRPGYEAALRFVAEHTGPFQVRELPIEEAGHDKKVELARYLCRLGLLAIYDL